MAVKQLKDDEFIIEDDEKEVKAVEETGEQEEEEEEVKKAEATDSDDDDDDDNDDSDNEQEGAGETDEEREAIRERRRLERQQKKEYRKRKEEQARRELAQLREERREMAERLAILERKSTGSEAAQIESAIEDNTRMAEMLKSQIQQAMEAGDGVALAEATDRMYEVRKRNDDLHRLREMQRRSTQQSQRPQTQQAVDPMLKQHAADWMSKNSWYDPQGSNQDSKIALAIDSTLAEEGWDPRTPEFWDELSSRIAQALPHRAAKKPSTSTTTTTTQRRKPGTTTSGSGRDGASSSGGKVFKLSPDRVQAMKDAGIWEDVEKRNEMIKEYAAYDKAHKE